MAIASRWLAARYNKPGFKLFDFNVWVQCSDGDLMEGVSNEAASIAGHLKLSNLCWIYDNNHITIEGKTDLAFSEDVATRFRGLGWHVLAVPDANDLAAIEQAYQGFLSHKGSPTLIIVKSVIGYGAPTKAGTSKAHGEPLGAEEIAKTKEFYGWPADAKFLVPPEVPKKFPGHARQARPGAIARPGTNCGPTTEEVPGTGGRAEDDLEPQAARRLG